jgi:uncharacterized protein (DUF1778 family)
MTKKNRSAIVYIRLTQEARALLELAAERDQRSLSYVASMLVEDGLKAKRPQAG